MRSFAVKVLSVLYFCAVYKRDMFQPESKHYLVHVNVGNKCLRIIV